MRQLTMTKEDGTPYTRSSTVEEQIVETSGWPDSDLIARHKSLLNETLLYHVRNYRQRDDHICGMLLQELMDRSVYSITKHYTRIHGLGLSYEIQT